MKYDEIKALILGLHRKRMEQSKIKQIVSNKVVIAEKEKITEIGYRELGKLKNDGIEMLIHDELPPFVQEVKQEKPLWLFVKGNKNLLFSENAVYVAIVGTRKPDMVAKNHIKVLMDALQQYPVIIVSGLADGIDNWVHEISMQCGIKNVAFPGHGFYVSMSEKQKILMDKVVESGGVIASEYFPDDWYSRDKFLKRNRLIATISDIVIPVQANIPSGTYSTVISAFKNNKTVIGIKMENSGIVQLLNDRDCSIIDLGRRQDITKLQEIVNIKISNKCEIKQVNKPE